MDKILGSFAPLVLIMICAFFFGMYAGYGLQDSSWVNDCNELGLHRIVKTVYICEKKK